VARGLVLRPDIIIVIIIVVVVVVVVVIVIIIIKNVLIKVTSKTLEQGHHTRYTK